MAGRELVPALGSVELVDAQGNVVTSYRLQLSSDFLASLAGTNVANVGLNTAGAQLSQVASLVYGGGDDGACVFDGTNTFPFASLVGSTYTLTSDVFLGDGSHVLAGVTLVAAGFRVYCNGTLTNDGTVLADGKAASGATPGGSSALGTTGIGTAGGAGHVGVAAGSNGTNQSNTLGDSDLGSPAGGHGGAGGAQAGGNGGTYVNSGTNGGAHNIFSMTTGFLTTATSGGNQAQLGIIGGGAGGGGGGSDNAGATGGGGGGGGGVLVLCVFNLVNNGTIRAAGGKGADATGSAGNAGGGGGGGGGIILNVSRFRSGSGTMTAPGGLGGAHFGASGVDGAPGSAGQVHQHAA